MDTRASCKSRCEILETIRIFECFFFPISLDGISMLLLGAPSTIVVLRFNFNLGDALQCYEDDDLILILVLTQPRGEQNRP
jgi:hypothetical protein